MLNETDYYKKKLKDEFSLRQRKSPSYSQRAYSRDLKMHPSTLALVLNGKRPIPKKNIDHIILYLSLSPTEEYLFRESVDNYKSTPEKSNVNYKLLDTYLINESHYKIIAEWEHYAVITLLELDDFISTKNNISKRLNLNKNRTEIILENLINAELIKKDKLEMYTLTKGQLRTTEDVSSKALRSSHKETMEMGTKKIDEVSIQYRDFSSTTIAVCLENLPKAKKIIRDFRKNISSLLSDGKKTEVYQLAVQLYPLTQLINEKIGEENETTTNN